MITDFFDEKEVARIQPAAVYPKAYVDKLLEDIAIIRRDIAAGRQRTFDNIDDLILSLEGDE